MAAPLETTELQLIASNACEKAIGSAEKYDHTLVADWNTTIINTILQQLIEKASTNDSKTPAYKYIANSTIIQHIGDPAEAGSAGRRGMHSAVGAFWNNEKDGTWSFKWEGAEAKGMDIVVSVTWIGL